VDAMFKGFTANKEHVNAKRDVRIHRKKEEQMLSFLDLQKRPLRYNEELFNMKRSMPGQELSK
jgi:hypothetical protein